MYLPFELLPRETDEPVENPNKCGSPEHKTTYTGEVTEVAEDEEMETTEVEEVAPLVAEEVAPWLA